jgi:hypothetical protein
MRRPVTKLLIMESSKNSKLLSVNKSYYSTFHSISLSDILIRCKLFIIYPQTHSLSSSFPMSLFLLQCMCLAHLFCVHKVALPDSAPPLVSATIQMFPHYTSLTWRHQLLVSNVHAKILPNISRLGHGPQLCGVCIAYVWQWNDFKSNILQTFQVITEVSMKKTVCQHVTSCSLVEIYQTFRSNVQRVSSTLKTR